MTFPFRDDGEIRTFNASVDADELKWHWDEEHRIVTPLNRTDWLVQMDGQLPQQMIIGQSFVVPAGVWHRAIKGTGFLHLRIQKYAVLD